MRLPSVALLGMRLGCSAMLAADSAVKVDNADVRIASVVDLPHHHSPMYQHDLNRVMIYLNGGDMTLITEDGRVDPPHWKAEQVA